MKPDLFDRFMYIFGITAGAVVIGFGLYTGGFSTGAAVLVSLGIWLIAGSASAVSSVFHRETRDFLERLMSKDKS